MTHLRRALAVVLAVVLGFTVVGCAGRGPDYLQPDAFDQAVRQLATRVGSTQIVSITASHELLMVRFAKNGQQVEARAWNGVVMAPGLLDPLNTPLDLASLDLKKLAAVGLAATNECTDPTLLVSSAGPGQGYSKLTCKKGVRQVWWADDATPMSINLNTEQGLADALRRAEVGMPMVTKVSVGSGRGNQFSVFTPGQDWGMRLTLKDGRVPTVFDYGHEGPAFRLRDLSAQKIHDCAAHLMLLGGQTTWFTDIYARADGQIILAFQVPGGWYPVAEGMALTQDCEPIAR